MNGQNETKGEVHWLLKAGSPQTNERSESNGGAFPALQDQIEIEREALSDDRIDDLRLFWLEARADHLLKVRAPLVEAITCLALIAIILVML